jgi:hypothetical protein
VLLDLGEVVEVVSRPVFRVRRLASPISAAVLRAKILIEIFTARNRTIKLAFPVATVFASGPIDSNNLSRMPSIIPMVP